MKYAVEYPFRGRWTKFSGNFPNKEDAEIKAEEVRLNYGLARVVPDPNPDDETPESERELIKFLIPIPQRKRT